MKDPHLYLLHIAECIAKIERYTSAASDRGLDDEMLYDAVVRNLQTLSEATQRLPDAIKDRHPTIPWQRIIGFRNVLVHDYLGGIKASVVWNVIDKELPGLKAAVQSEIDAAES